MSPDLVFIAECFEELKLDKDNLSLEDMVLLADRLKELEQKSLANFILNLKTPNELLDYIEV